MQSYSLAPGITLRHFETHVFLTRTYTIWFRLPLCRADATQNALLPDVLKRGCTAFPTARDIQRRAESLSGTAFTADAVKKGEEQLLRFSLETTRDVSVADALGFLREMLLRPLAENGCLNKAHTDAARETLRKAILSRANDKRTYARLRCLEELCRNEPFGVYGDGYAEDLDAADARALYARYKTILSQTAAEIITIGDMDADDLAASIQAILPFPRKGVSTPPEASFAIPDEPTRTTQEHMDAAQGKLCIGLRAGVPSSGQAYCDLLVANALFGGGGDAKLFTNVREKAQLCYYVSSSYYRFKSILLVESGLDPADFTQAETLIAKEMESMRAGDFTQEALDKAKKTLARHIRTLADDPATLADFTMAQVIAGDESSGLAEVVRSIEAVTKDSCQTAFSQMRLVLTYRLSPQETTQKGETAHA